MKRDFGEGLRFDGEQEIGTSFRGDPVQKRRLKAAGGKKVTAFIGRIADDDLIGREKML